MIIIILIVFFFKKKSKKSAFSNARYVTHLQGLRRCSGHPCRWPTPHGEVLLPQRQETGGAPGSLSEGHFWDLFAEDCRWWGPTMRLQSERLAYFSR